MSTSNKITMPDTPNVTLEVPAANTFCLRHSPTGAVMTIVVTPEPKDDPRAVVDTIKRSLRAAARAFDKALNEGKSDLDAAHAAVASMRPS